MKENFMNFKHILISLFFTSCIVSAESIKSIEPQELLPFLKQDPGAYVVDIRSYDEIVKSGRIQSPSFMNIQRGNLDINVRHNILTKDANIILYSNGNNRSMRSTKTLIEMGYPNTVYLNGGYDKWKSLGLPTYVQDKYIGSPLYSKLIKISDNVYTSIGAPHPPTIHNTGHNNNLSFIIGDDAVAVFNAGGSWLVAAAFHNEIKKITSKPVKYVALENHQSHASLGASYWSDVGATIVSLDITASRIKSSGHLALSRAKERLGDKIINTKVYVPDVYFSDTLKLDFKGEDIQLIHFGEAHEPDDISLWLPNQSILISGDFAFNDRILPIHSSSNIDNWIASWPKMVALEPKIIIPGHGAPTDLATVTRNTLDYIVALRDTAFRILEDDGDLLDAINSDFSDFDHLVLYRLLRTQNIERIFNKYEFDF